MDFLAYRAQLARLQSSKWTPRQKRLNALSRVLGRHQYDHIATPFSQEHEGNNPTGNRILLDDRRPAVKNPLPAELVREQCGLLFGEDHRPVILVKDDKPTTEWIEAFIEDTNFWLTMIDALWKASVGSAAIVLRVLGNSVIEEQVNPETNEVLKEKTPKGPGHFYFEVWKGEECKPRFDRARPDTLIELDRCYFLGEDALAAQGYNVEELKEKWDEKDRNWRRGSGFRKGKLGVQASLDWTLRIKLDCETETWYKPVPRYIYERADWTENQWEVDEDRTVEHGLEEVPAWWILPLPVDSDEYYPDGVCLFEDVIDFQYRIDRSASQSGRALDYAGDPQLVDIKGKNGQSVGAGAFGTPTALGGTAADVLTVEGGGDAKFIEITGEGIKVAIETYISTLQDLARRAGAMSRVVPESKTGANSQLSSIAMRMLNFAQLTLAGVLRLTVGQTPGQFILRLAMKMAKKVDVELPSLDGKSIEPNEKVRQEWQWPNFYEPVGQEKLFEVQAATTAAQGGGISKQTMVANLGPLFDVTDPDEELESIKSDQADDMTSRVAEANEMGAVEAKYGAVKASSSGANPSAKGNK